MFLEFYFFPTINVLFMYTVSDCHEKAIIKSMQFTSQIERLLYNIIGFEPTKWTIYYTFTFINSDLILEKSLKIPIRNRKSKKDSHYNDQTENKTNRQTIIRRKTRRIDK